MPATYFPISACGIYIFIQAQNQISKKWENSKNNYFDKKHIAMMLLTICLVKHLNSINKSIIRDSKIYLFQIKH